jgi:hypothetical protein
MTSNELKQIIDTLITLKTEISSISPNDVGFSSKKIVDYINQEILSLLTTVIPGPVGPIGPQGVPGPVGPAGLEWQGQWVDTNDYNLNDAVGYNGASYFCINTIDGDPSNQDPETDVTTWALLASQGSVGPQGPQGIPGVAPVKTFSNITATSDFGNYPVITSDLCLVISGGTGRRVVLPDAQPVGKEIIIYAGNTNFSFFVQNAQVSTPGLSPEGVQSYVSSFEINPNRNYKFTSLGSNFWKIEELTINKKIVYRAKITQSNTNNPVVSNLENNTVRTYSMTRINVGHYRLTPSIALSSNIDFQLTFNSNAYDVPTYTIINNLNNIDIFVKYWDGETFVLSDNVINNTILKLELS